MFPLVVSLLVPIITGVFRRPRQIRVGLVELNILVPVAGTFVLITSVPV